MQKQQIVYYETINTLLINQNNIYKACGHFKDLLKLHITYHTLTSCLQSGLAQADRAYCRVAEDIYTVNFDLSQAALTWTGIYHSCTQLWYIYM